MRMSRKMEHVEHALRIGQVGNQGLADIKFVHNCLPDASVDDIHLHTAIGDLDLSSPILINAMTGGADETRSINRELAVAARECGLAMAVGSQMSAIKNPEVASSYRVVRSVNPDGILIGNLGSEATVEQALRAVEMIGANALQIHLNVMQELIMPEGDRSFKGALERIADIASNVPVPVIVKEVGFGIMRESAAKLIRLPIAAIDVGGTGGTNFAAIENARRPQAYEWLNDWGNPTAIALLESLSVWPRGRVIASGGIRNGLECAKALALGASAAGIAGAALRVLQTEGTAALIDYLRRIHEELRLVMTALGAASIEELWNVPLVVSGESAEWCELRGIDIRTYARRQWTETGRARPSGD
ncbi:type 2 isopentenyl-diphosphate Delta-isomerase [Paenibacillus thermoaerophilus]|uniref:Isopentenyl-diphosphate delta-isomerase n=1 Tax=Paenibacillus thermoaerophilus TaxID=1215385 RepID=A0ABW2V2V1_9BACL|nr:type 2 isopentenyl-diphosphate Delta-isomerase [Paenibacillus thermoaerophilus]TMV18724.1 type 2 isopentenyl-diphosphate Delta-isomerase [Paenibacillus thermoaerophilus]